VREVKVAPAFRRGSDACGDPCAVMQAPFSPVKQELVEVIELVVTDETFPSRASGTRSVLLKIRARTSASPSAIRWLWKSLRYEGDRRDIFHRVSTNDFLDGGPTLVVMRSLS